MYYYVAHDDVNDGVYVYKFETRELASVFITETMKHNSGTGLADFEVIYGLPVNVKEVTVKAVTLEVMV